jgi:hypothetical protein
MGWKGTYGILRKIIDVFLEVGHGFGITSTESLAETVLHACGSMDELLNT